MGFIVNLITGLGTFIYWGIKKFAPFFIKKYGKAVIKQGLQKTVSSLVVIVSVAFYGAVIIFISETFTRFRAVMDILNNPISQVSGGESVKYFNCFLSLLHTSGIAEGFNSAFSFGISVLIFFFLRGLYSITLKSVSHISEELSKSLKLI